LGQFLYSSVFRLFIGNYLFVPGMRQEGKKGPLRKKIPNMGSNIPTQPPCPDTWSGRYLYKEKKLALGLHSRWVRIFLHMRFLDKKDSKHRNNAFRTKN